MLGADLPVQTTGSEAWDVTHGVTLMAGQIGRWSRGPGPSKYIVSRQLRNAIQTLALMLEAFRLGRVGRHAERTVSGQSLLEHPGGTLVVAGGASIQEHPGVQAG